MSLGKILVMYHKIWRNGEIHQPQIRIDAYCKAADEEAKKRIV